MTGFARRLAALVLPPLAVFLAVLAVWHVVTVRFDVPEYVVPPPGGVLDAAVKSGAKLARAAWLTGAAALCGLAVSVVVGVLVAFAFSQARLVRRAFYPYAIFLQTVPIVAIAPVIVIWVGQEFRSVVLVAHIVSLFPIITNTTQGLTSVDRNLLELFRIHNASRLQVLLRLRFPNAVPNTMTGIKTSSGLAVIGAIVGEFFTGYGESGQGLGFLIQLWGGQLRTAELFAAIFASTLLGLVIFAAASLVEDLIASRWRD